MIKGSCNSTEGSLSLYVMTLPGHGDRGSGDVKFLTYHLTSHDHLFKELYNFICGSFS